MKLYLKYLEPETDADFLNETSIEFYFPKDKENDSGWCCAATGYRILDRNDSVVFNVRTQEDESFLKFRYGERICEADSVM